MDRLQKRLDSAERALRAFKQLVQIDQPNEIERDASIQRFEFTYEACLEKVRPQSKLT